MQLRDSPLPLRLDGGPGRDPPAAAPGTVRPALTTPENHPGAVEQ